MPDLHGDEMKSSTRWGMVTFALGICCGIMGRYLPPASETWVGAVLMMSAIFGIFGALAISEKD